MAKRPRYTAAQVAAALRAHRGLALHAAKALGCDPQTIWNYVHRHLSVEVAMREARGDLIDLAESRLEAAIARDEWQAIQFTLRTLGKDRGWADPQRHELRGADGQPVVFTIQLDRPTDAADD